MRRGYILLTLTACIGASFARADLLPGTVRSLLRLYAQNRDPGDLNDLTETDAVSAYLHDRIVEEATPGRISISTFRNDLQLGSFAATGASTSIVAQPGLTDLISAAMETGAVSRKTDTEAVTTSFNALPVYQIMSGRIPAGCGGEDEDCFRGPGRWIRGLSGSVSFALSNSTTPVPATTTSAGAPSLAGFLFSGQQLSALSARYELLVRERDPKNLQNIVDNAASALSDQATSFLTAQGALEIELQQILTKANWPAETKLALQGETSYSRMEEILLVRYRLAYNLARQAPEFQALLAGMIPAQTAYIKAQNTLLAEKLYRKALTLDYVHQRPSDQPWLDQARLVFSTPLGSQPESAGESLTSAVPPGSFTLNAGATFYRSIPQNAASGRVRDAELSAALDWSPAGWGDVRPTYTVAYYFQYMIENAVVQFNGDAATPGEAAVQLPGSAVEVLKTKGPIHIAQLGLNIPAGNTGISFPVAVSWSNRTELITGKSFWQGHVGVSYDLGRLKTLFEPGPN
jgi:hypothetical protein